MLRLLMAVAVLVSAMASTREATAQQRGGVIQDLFRSVAQAQLEREQRKRLEAEAQAQTVERARINANRGVPGVPGVGGVPNAGFPGGGVVGGGVVGPFSNLGRVPGSTLGTATWQQLRGEMDAVINDLRSVSGRSGTAMRLVPTGYRLTAQIDQMIADANRGDTAAVASAFAAFDRDYRTFAFETSRILPGGTADRLRRTDAIIAQLEQSMNVRPQWDRMRFAEIALTSRTLLQTILDDTRLISLSGADRRQINHDLNLLVTRIDRIRSQIDRITFEQASATFNDFATQLASVGVGLRRLNDPHIDLRLDRLRELRDDSYGLFWTEPPEALRDIRGIADRLQRSSRQLSQSVASAGTMPDRVRRDAASIVRDVTRAADDVAAFAVSQSGTRSIEAPLQRLDAETRRLEDLLRYQPGTHHAPLALLRDDVHLLMRESSVASASAALDHASLVRLGATLEGGGEALHDAIDRRDRNLRSRQFKSQLDRSVDEFYRQARKFYEDVDDHRDIDSLRARVGEMLNQWQTMNQLIADLNRQGMSATDAAVVGQYRDALIPAVAEAAAMFGIGI